MPRKVRNKRSKPLYFNSKQSNVTPKEPIRKINIIDVKSIHGNKMSTLDPPKKKEIVLTLRDVLNNYLESTSVHGLQYFGKTEIKIGILGKILWTCTMVICFVCLSLMLLQFLRRYNENPINTYTRTFNAPIYQAPFPAVSICPIVPLSMRTRLAILENVVLPENVSREFALNILKYGHHITHPYATKSFNDMDKLKAFLNANKWTITNFLKILIPCEDIFESCWWTGERIDCSKSLKASDSSYGLCCSFNYHLADYIGYNKQVLH
ncbi:sodium channel protein Nach-like [Xylocopa sonorina]|uniref:sodium channel protein Nach-like n=1 Tax=Xylocopa sonorina TaxID=1818115 RepID=UPI00403AFBF6